MIFFYIVNSLLLQEHSPIEDFEYHEDFVVHQWDIAVFSYLQAIRPFAEIGFRLKQQ